MKTLICTGITWVLILGCDYATGNKPPEVPDEEDITFAKVGDEVIAIYGLFGTLDLNNTYKLEIIKNDTVKIEFLGALNPAQSRDDSLASFVRYWNFYKTELIEVERPYMARVARLDLKKTTMYLQHAKITGIFNNVPRGNEYFFDNLFRKTIPEPGFNYSEITVQ